MTKKKKSNSVAQRTIYYYWQELKQHKLFLTIILICLPISILAGQFALPYIISVILDIITTQTITMDTVWVTFLPYIIGAGVVMLIQRITSWSGLYSLWTLELKSYKNLASKIFNKLVYQSVHFHNDRFGGSLVSQTSKFIKGFERLFDTIIFNFFPIVLQIIFTIIILGPVVPWFVVGLLILISAYVLVVARSFKKIDKLSEIEAEAQNKQSGQLADSISNIMSVKSYAGEKYEKKQFGKVTSNVFETSFNFMKACFNRDVMFGMIYIVLILLLYTFFATGNTLFGLSVGTLVLMFTYTNNLVNNLWDINNLFRDVSRVFGDAHEITKILDLPNSVDDKENAKSLNVKKGEINVDKVSFEYIEGNEPLFSGMNLKIAPGQRVGLVGRSGGGKTTLTKLLLRFADVQKGQITIDGQDISDVTQESLRKNIAYVPQETTLFHRSIMENIAYGKPNATRDEVIKAAKQANAWEFIKNLPEGLDTLTGERGVKLSGGQRQRVAIARAILKNAPILILDEATASLDTESEKLIQEAMGRLMKGRTSIVIAHRLSTVAELDRIIVLDKGKIIEDGTHQELVKKKGMYAKLWNKQTGLLID